MNISPLHLQDGWHHLEAETKQKTEAEPKPSSSAPYTIRCFVVRKLRKMYTDFVIIFKLC